MTLDGPRLLPSDGRIEKLVILAHGFGADGRDLIALAEHWRPLLPHTAFVSPNAPQRCDMSPAGYQWFPLDTLNPGRDRSATDIAAATFNAFIDAELSRFSLTPGDLALVGFSQGTMMSLYVGLRRAEPVAGILGFSGMLISPGTLETEISAHPPVFLMHGSADELIPARASVEAAELLDTLGVPAQFHIASGIGHGIAPEEVFLGGDFLKRVLHP
jgi:phospholipase/carboxylesterase